MDMNDWLEALAAKQPTPGGGAAAGLAAAVAAALTGMVSIYTTGDKWAERSERMQAISDEAGKLRMRALELMADDEQAFAAVGAAYKLPKDSPQNASARELGIQTALAGAATPPKQIIELVAEIIPLLQELVETGNPNVLSDVAVGASFASTALESAIVNIEINKKLITDSVLQEKLQQSVAAATEQVRHAQAIVKAVREGMQA